MGSQLHHSLLHLWINCGPSIDWSKYPQNKFLVWLTDMLGKSWMDKSEEEESLGVNDRDKNKMIQLIPINCHGFEK